MFRWLTPMDDFGSQKSRNHLGSLKKNPVNLSFFFHARCKIHTRESTISEQNLEIGGGKNTSQPMAGGVAVKARVVGGR